MTLCDITNGNRSLSRPPVPTLASDAMNCGGPAKPPSIASSRINAGSENCEHLSVPASWTTTQDVEMECVDNDPQEVSEYVADINNRLLQDEKQYCPEPNYMERQTD